MADKLEVTVTEPKDENLKKFQKLLAYFVWHLEYMNGKFVGEQNFCGKNQKMGKQSGRGYNEEGIQENIKEWETLDKGRVCITVENGRNVDKYYRLYTTEDSYLNWAGFFAGNVSIYAVWSEDKEEDNGNTISGKGPDGRYHIESLRIKNKWKNLKSSEDENLKKIDLSDLGIHVTTTANIGNYDSDTKFTNKKRNNQLKDFYEAFVVAKRLETKQRLQIAKNIIFTGAPGTGKTYLAKEIADLIEAETEFVQFHPSYDYTDFVEGLRPVKDSNNPNQIVFERKDGIFKAFCERALIQWLNDQLTKVTSTTTTSSSPCTTNNVDVYEKIWKLLNGIKLEEESNLTDGETPAKETKELKESESTESENGKQHPTKEEEIEAIKKLIVDIKKRIEEKNKKVKEEGKVQQEKKKKAEEVSSAQGQINTPKPFVFIIDEINRGEISKIFGELFFSVDPGYRGIEGAVKTQYANLQTTPNLFDLLLIALGKANEGDYGHFFIPENVYIIGTMNDIDRSVESMDFAFRRRFTFIEITAKETQRQILNSMEEVDAKKAIESLVKKMDELNKTIYNPKNKSTDNQYDLSDAYHIGAAYFKHYEDYVGQDKPLDKLWDNHLKGVLYEYLRGKPNADETLKKWKNAYSDGMLSLVDLSVDKLKKHISEEEVEDIIGTIELCIRDNIAMGKTQLQNEVLNRFDDAKKSSIKQAWKKESRNSKKEEAKEISNDENE